MIYFIEAVGLDLIKIGHTNGDPAKRLRRLQTGSGCQLVLRGVLEGGPAEERRLHEYLARFKERGEWFRLDTWICDLLSVWHMLADKPREHADRMAPVTVDKAAWK